MGYFADKRVMVVATVILLMAAGCSSLSTTESPMSATETSGNSLNNKPPSSATIAFTSIPIQTTPPTLSPTEVSGIVMDMYIDNGGCELPCLWGITPGKTRIQEMEGKFAQIGTFRNITRPVDNFQTVVFTVLAPADLGGIYNDESWSFHVRLENNVVVGLLTGVTVIEEFSNPSLSTFLASFGRPEEIWIDIIPNQSGDPDFSIALYYPSKGIFINWRGTVDSVVSETENNVTVMVCPQYMPTNADTALGSYSPYFYLFSPKVTMSFEEIIVQHLAGDPSYRMLDKANTEILYTTYLDPNAQGCFPFSYP